MPSDKHQCGAVHKWVGLKNRVENLKCINVGEILDGPLLEIKKIKGDGNYLFRALAYGCTLDGNLAMLNS